MEVGKDGAIANKNILSNESIIYTYLIVKGEVIDLDSKLKQLDIFVRDNLRDFDAKVNGESEAIKILETLAKMSGAELPPIEEIIREKREQLLKLQEELGGHIKKTLEYKLKILEELQMAFDVLKDVMPEEVEKFNKHITWKPKQDNVHGL